MKDSEEASHNVEQTKIEIAASLLQTKAAISRAKKRVDQLKDEFPLDIDAVLEAESEVEEFQSGQVRLERLAKELELN